MVWAIAIIVVVGVILAPIWVALSISDAYHKADNKVVDNKRWTI